jgi:hypothetical protein
VLSCVTDEYILNYPGCKPETQSTFTFQRNPTALGDSGLTLFFRQNFYPTERNSGRWKITTVKYEYAIEVAETKQEVLAYHWDRDTAMVVPYAHMHLGFANTAEEPLIGPKAHIPTGRVAVEDLVFFTIQELRIHPRRDDWRTVIAEARRVFMAHKTW